ncbi:MAG TPA: hypothetical protein PLS00_01470, partial [Niabella sp.]|nr:hypothetical protein [Niabella sp.]
RGKYYNDGHRNCKISISPKETTTGICTVCGRLLTVGAAHRVEQLSNRGEQEAENSFQPFRYILPLPEMLAEIMGFSETSKAVEKKYAQAISYFGNEFDLLMHTPVEDIRRFHPTLAIAIERLRKDEKRFTPGYDGEHGRIYFFNEGELKRKPEQATLF